MPKLPVLSGQEAIKALEKFGFKALRQKGSHIILVKQNGERIGTVVPLHKELDIGTLKGILKKAGISEEDFISGL